MARTVHSLLPKLGYSPQTAATGKNATGEPLIYRAAKHSYLMYIFTHHAPRVAPTILAGCPVSNTDSNTTQPPEL